jgi:ribosome recycling factor
MANVNDGAGAVAANEEGCKSTLLAFKKELQKVRTGRASAGMLEGISVDYYGSKTPLVHLGQISTPEARIIQIQVFDSGAAVPVEKAIQAAGLGFNPSREGNTLRIVVPVLTSEARKDIVKFMHKIAEDARISIRNHRKDANDHLKKFEKDVSKDEIKRFQDKIQKTTDASTHEIDELLKVKEKEILDA